MIAPDRLPWEIVETFPSTNPTLVAEWENSVATAGSAAERARALVGRALVMYWAVAMGAVDSSWDAVAQHRASDLSEAVRLARSVGSADILAEALLGTLYAQWGPDNVHERVSIVEELDSLRADVVDEELRLRILEWIVLGHLDEGDLNAARSGIEEFTVEAAGTDLILFHRREILWRANIDMLVGDIDRSLRFNQEVISATADTAGSPFSFQNVAITLAIERFFRRGLADVVDAVRSIRASSPRVAPNWDTGLAFALSEAGQLDEATELFEELARDGFAPVPRDLNWLVTVQLLGLVALTLDDRPRMKVLLDLLRPFAGYDATHGSGYASYGPVARVVAALAARCGEHEEAEQWFEYVLTTREPGPWTSLTLYDRALARRSTNSAGALVDAVESERQLRSLGLDGWAEAAEALAVTLRLEGHGDPIARLADGRWTFRHPSGTATIRESVGARYLVELLARPGAALDAARLDPKVNRLMPTEASAESVIDQRARSEYRRRLDDLDRLDTLSDSESAERSFLGRELAGSRHVVSTSRELERARVRVTKAIRRTVDSIAQGSPGLGEHLRVSVETGRRCLYRPADGAVWRIERHPS